MKLGAAITVAVAAVALIATASTAGAAPSAPHERSGLVPHIRHARHHLASTSRSTKLSKLNCIATCPAYESKINQYFTDVAAAGVAGATDNVYSVATQYTDQSSNPIQYSETFDAHTNAYVDTNPYPVSKTCNDGSDKYCVTDQQLQSEIGKVIAAHGWPTHSKTALYFIFTPANVGLCIYPGDVHGNFCTTNAFCAYHSTSVSKSFFYAVEPDAQAISDAACDPLQYPAGNGADATINTISHEQIEAITNPDNGGWYAGDEGHEIADLCAYDFGTPLGLPGTEYNQVINGHNYFLQLEYSNEAASGAGGCVPYSGGPVTAADPLNGTGPMTYHGGDVMTTNTVYAIYWVPAAPANVALPTISGVTKVGKTLKAANGKWSNGPKFTYRWLRCTFRHGGRQCVGIKAATGSAYKLVAADAGHRIEMRVTATNMIGSRSAISAPTGTVKK